MRPSGPDSARIPELSWVGGVSVPRRSVAFALGAINELGCFSCDGPGFVSEAKKSVEIVRYVQRIPYVDGSRQDAVDRDQPFD